MALIKYATRMIIMDHLIGTKRTGCAEEFAKKLEISRRQLLLDLRDMRDMGVNVRYSRILKSYYYEEDIGLSRLFRMGLN